MVMVVFTPGVGVALTDKSSNIFIMVKAIGNLLIMLRISFQISRKKITKVSGVQP